MFLNKDPLSKNSVFIRAGPRAEAQPGVLRKRIKMGLPVFDTCCGCIELRTGCLIIGYLQLVAQIIFSILILVLLTAGGVEAASDDKTAQQGGTLLIALSIIMLIFLILFLTFTIVLLVGLHKDKPGHVKAYIIFATIFLVINVITFLAGFANTPIKAGNVVGNLLGLLLSLYFLLVIRSHYVKMGDSSKGPAVYSAA